MCSLFVLWGRGVEKLKNFVQQTAKFVFFRPWLLPYFFTNYGV